MKKQTWFDKLKSAVSTVKTKIILYTMLIVFATVTVIVMLCVNTPENDQAIEAQRVEDEAEYRWTIRTFGGIR